MISTTVTIPEYQKKFVKDSYLKHHELIRDKIDDLMEGKDE